MFLLSEIAGLPAHALLVHAAVILVPLAAIGLTVLGWRSDWRRTYLLPVALVAIAGAAFAVLAAQTGEPLEHSVRAAARAQGVQVRFGEHPENGDTAELFAIVLAVTALAFWALDRWHRRFKLPTWSPAVAYAVALIPAALALVTIVVAGHSGAELVWKDVGSYAAAR